MAHRPVTVNPSFTLGSSAREPAKVRRQASPHMGAVVGQAYQPVERVADVATLNLALGEREYDEFDLVRRRIEAGTIE